MEGIEGTEVIAKRSLRRPLLSNVSTQSCQFRVIKVPMKSLCTTVLIGGYGGACGGWDWFMEPEGRWLAGGRGC